MARRWLYAEVTYSGGHALVTQGIRFQFNKPKKIIDRKKAQSFEGKPNFNVVDCYNDIIQKISDIEVEEFDLIEMEPEIDFEPEPELEPEPEPEPEPELKPELELETIEEKSKETSKKDSKKKILKKKKATKKGA